MDRIFNAFKLSPDAPASDIAIAYGVAGFLLARVL